MSNSFQLHINIFKCYIIYLCPTYVKDFVDEQVTKLS